MTQTEALQTIAGRVVAYYTIDHEKYIHLRDFLEMQRIAKEGLGLVSDEPNEPEGTAITEQDPENGR